jgi:hypothetical protein
VAAGAEATGRQSLVAGLFPLGADITDVLSESNLRHGMLELSVGGDSNSEITIWSCRSLISNDPRESRDPRDRGPFSAATNSVRKCRTVSMAKDSMLLCQENAPPKIHQGLMSGVP